MEPVLYFKAALRELFPPDHPDTPWLLRLAILRDDIAHELHSFAGQDRGDTSRDSAWHGLYGARKITISIGEVDAIFNWHPVRKRLSADDLGPELSDALNKGRDAVREAFEILKPIRDGLGGHVQPLFAVQKTHKRDPIPGVIRALGEDVFELRLDTETGRTTNFRNLTVAAVLFIWPDIKTADEAVCKLHELFDQLEKCLTPIIHSIDLLLYLHWTNAGIQPTATATL